MVFAFHMFALGTGQKVIRSSQSATPVFSGSRVLGEPDGETLGQPKKATVFHV